MHSEAAVLDLVDCIYAAAEDPARWDVFLERIGLRLRSTLNAIVFEDVRTRHASVARSVGFDPAYIPAYENYFAARNAWMLAATPGRFGPGSIATSEELLSDSVFLKTEYYNDFLKKMGSRYLVGSFVSRDRSSLAHLSLIAPKRRGPFGSDDVRVLRILTPHVRRALELHRQVVELRAEKQAATDSLDRFEVGVVVVDCRGRTILTNRAAERIFGSGDGLALHKEGLAAARHDETAALRKLVSESVMTAVRDGIGSGGVMSVSRRSLRRAYAVFVTPLRARTAVFGDVEASAAIFITDPEHAVETSPEALRRLYGLTPAESRLASRLMSGESLECAADGLAVTLHTARTHLKRLFEKTSTNRQAELVRFLLLSCASLSRGSA